MQWEVHVGSPAGSKASPGSGRWTNGANMFAAEDTESTREEEERLDELRWKLATRLQGAPPDGLAFALGLLVSQAREISQLRRALRIAQAGSRPPLPTTRGPRPLPMQASLEQRNTALEMEVAEFAAEAADARRLEVEQGALCAELAKEATLLAAQAESVRGCGRLRIEHLEAERLSGIESEGKELRAEVAEYQRGVASEMWSLRLQASELQQECKELTEAAAAHARDGVRPWATSAANDHTKPDVPWHDAGRVFDMFASTSGIGACSIRPSDFGHLCESLRRAQGRGSTPNAERQGFAEFAFVAVFGEGVTEVHRSRFAGLFPAFAEGLEDLELAHRRCYVDGRCATSRTR